MARNDLTLFFPQCKYESDNNLQNFIASIEDSVQATQAEERTPLKRRSALYCDKGANSVASMMFGEKERPTDSGRETRKKSIIVRDTRRPLAIPTDSECLLRHASTSFTLLATCCEHTTAAGEREREQDAESLSGKGRRKE